MSAGVIVIKLGMTLGALRECFMGWVINATYDIESKDLIRKVCRSQFTLAQSLLMIFAAFELCWAGQFDHLDAIMMPQILDVLCNSATPIPTSSRNSPPRPTSPKAFLRSRTNLLIPTSSIKLVTSLSTSSARFLPLVLVISAADMLPGMDETLLCTSAVEELILSIRTISCSWRTSFNMVIGNSPSGGSGEWWGAPASLQCSVQPNFCSFSLFKAWIWAMFTTHSYSLLCLKVKVYFTASCYMLHEPYGQNDTVYVAKQVY